MAVCGRKGSQTLPTHVSARNASALTKGLGVDDLSQLMSPHGMHRAVRTCFSVMYGSQLMSPHGMHRAAGTPDHRSGRAPNSCLRTECITVRRSAPAETVPPNSCLRTECIMTRRLSANASNSSQLMSPHGMHHYLKEKPCDDWASQLMSPHGMHHNPVTLYAGGCNSQLMSPHGMHRLSPRCTSFILAPNSCLRTECI